MHALLNETMGSGENTIFASQLMYKIFKSSLIMWLWHFIEGCYATTNGTPLDPSDFLVSFSESLS